MAAMNGLISSLIQNAGQAVANTIKAAFDVKDKLKGAKKDLAKQKALAKEGMPAGNQALSMMNDAGTESGDTKETMRTQMASLANQTAAAMNKAGASDVSVSQNTDKSLGDSTSEMIQLSQQADAMAKAASQQSKTGLKTEVAVERAARVKENAVAMALFAQASGDQDGKEEERGRFLAENPEMVAKVLSDMNSNATDMTEQLGVASAQEILTQMIQSKDPNLQKAAAGAIANMPHNASANMENVMDAFTDPIDGIFDKEGMMAFMNTISNEGGELGQKMAREMLDSGSPYDPDTAKVKSGRFKSCKKLI